MKFEDELRRLLFHGPPGAKPSGKLYVSLHTDKPDRSQHEGEISYAGYARVAVDRSPTGWEVGDDGFMVSNAERVEFPHCVGGQATANYFAIGTYQFGRGTVLFVGALDPGVGVRPGDQPVFGKHQLCVSSDFDMTQFVCGSPVASCEMDAEQRVAAPAELDRAIRCLEERRRGRR